MSIFRKATASSVDLKKALAEIDLPALAGAIEVAEAERQTLLIDGTDEAVLAAEQRVTAARLAHDRATARVAELKRRIADAERREQRAALEAEHKAVADLADRTAKALKRDYVDAAGRLVEVLTRLRDAEKAVDRFNQRLGDSRELGSGIDRVARIECRVFEWPGPGEAGGYVSILHNTAIRHFKLPNGHPDESIPAWPPIGGV